VLLPTRVQYCEIDCDDLVPVLRILTLNRTLPARFSNIYFALGNDRAAWSSQDTRRHLNPSGTLLLECPRHDDWQCKQPRVPLSFGGRSIHHSTSITVPD
jgi:hypothetical protein